MTPEHCKEIAIKYCVEDLDSALIPNTRLSKILKSLELDEKPISIFTQEFLNDKGLLALLHYAKKESSFDDFLMDAEPEQSERRLKTEALNRQKQAEQKLKDEDLKLKNEAIQIKLRQKSQAKDKQSDLRRKYALDFFIEKSDFPKTMNILRRVDNGIRLSEDEMIWLNTEGEEYFTQELREGFHWNEAEYHAGQFKKNKDPWSVVNASSHYRKCRKARMADKMLNSIDVNHVKKLKLKSALCTTHGGVKRDLEKWEEALSLGEKAHSLTPLDFRPCTLLGAVNIEIGHFDEGQSWYKKAVERGFSEESVDDELRSIFMAAEKSKQEELRKYLLSLDPIRYSWTKKKNKQKTALKIDKILVVPVLIR